MTGFTFGPGKPGVPNVRRVERLGSDPPLLVASTKSFRRFAARRPRRLLDRGSRRTEAVRRTDRPLRLWARANDRSLWGWNDLLRPAFCEIFVQRTRSVPIGVSGLEIPQYIEPI